MFSNCQGYASQSNISAHTPSHSSYNNYGHHNPQPRGNFFTSCLQAVCGVDPSTSAGRKYSTTMDDNSSITALTQHNLNFEDECRISLSRFSKRVNGRDMRFIQASATLFDDEVDEAHDLFYLVQMPENTNPALSSANQQQHSSELAVRLLQSQQNHRSNCGGIQLPEQTKNYLGSHQTRKENDLAKSDPTQTNQVNNALRFLHRQTTTQKVNQLAANGAYQSSTGGPADFINQHTGSFTFHPAQTSEPGNRSFSGTHSSSQPNFNEKHSEIMGNMAIDAQGQDEAVRCDTDTHRQSDDQPRMHEMLKHSPARLMDSTILKGNNGDRNHVDYGASSTSSIMLQERHGQQVAVASGRRMMPRLPRTYGDLIANYTVQVKKDKKSGYNNVALGCFPLSKVPDGKYRIYYFRPKNRNRLIGGPTNSSSAQDKIQRVGKGQEFYIFDKNSSQSPSKHSVSSQPSFDHKQSMSLSSTTQQESIGQHQPSYQLLQSAGRTVPIQQFMKKSVSNKNKRSSKVAHVNKGGLSRPRVPSMNGQDSQSPNALAAQLLNENGDLSPDEVDLLVCRPDSLESDPYSKESFNTDKIRKENLGQNFANVIRSSGKEQNSSDSPNGMYESGLTFGANSAALSNQFAMSGSLKNMQASDTLSGLQEIYTVHQANLGQTAGEDTLKVPSIMTGGGCESPDTPNLYQTMSHASQHTASVEESLHDLAVQAAPIFLQSGSTGQPNADHEFIFPTQSEGSAKNSSDQRNGFILRLNAMNQSPDKNEFQKSKGGAAIRVEKQMSYTRSPSDSSADQPDQAEVQVITSSSNKGGVTSAFKAAENKVRNSQVQMFNQTNEAFQTEQSQEDSVDIVAPSSAEASITNKIMVHETLGPPIIVPSHSQQVDDLINEVVLSPMLNNKTSEDQVVSHSVETDMEQQNIRFFQQFIDTNGPTMCGGSNMITVMPLSGNIQQSDQSVLAQLGYSTGSSSQIQKHSRAIAFSDGAGVSMDSADQQQPPSLEEEQFLSPNKDAYREMIKHSNNQNATAVNYEQLTRNNGNHNQNCQKVMHTAPLGYSDKKQLSTVEEENASQCSDLTSLQHHHSRFMQTQQSSKSRKSLNRNSQQPVPLHQQNGNQNAPGSFCISEEPSETDIGDQAIEVVDLDVAQPYISDNKRISLIQETHTSGSSNVTDEKIKHLQQMSSANASANSTKTCSKQLSSQIKEGHLISGIQSLKIESKPSQQLSRPEIMNSSDYYSLKTSSPRQPQNQENDTNKLEDTSSSLLDLDNNDFNFTSELVSPEQADHQTGRALTEEQRQILSLSPYLLSPSEQIKKDEPISNFKNKRSLKRTGQDQTFQSQDKEHSQESELIESVNLNCSENFQEEQDVMERQDSTALIQLIDNFQLNPEEQKSTTQSEQTKFVAQTKSSSVTKSSIKGQSSKKSSGKQNTRKRNIFANSGSSASIKNGHLIVNSQSSSAKENLHSEKDNFTQHVSGLSKKSSMSKQSLKHLTPIINKSSNNQNLKLHQLVQKHVMATPQINTSCKKRKLDFFANSERKLIFVPTGTSTSQSSPQLTLFSQTSATKGHLHTAVPPQPLIKSKEIFVGKNSSQSQFLQNTQAQHKVSKKQGLHTGKQHLTTLNAKQGNFSTVKQSNQNESDKSAAQTSLTKLLMQNARST